MNYAASTAAGGRMHTDPTTLPGLLLHRAASTPDRPFMTDLDHRTMSYSDTVDEVRRWSAAWSGIGVGSGDHVVTMQLNSQAAFCGWLGLAAIGAIEVPINIDYRGSLLTHALNLTRARVLAITEDFLPRLVEVAPELEHLRTVVLLDGEPEVTGSSPFEVVGRSALHATAGAPDIPVPEPWEIAVVIFTSGTTGPSKAVQMTWAQLHATATGMLPVGSLEPDDVIHNPGPTFHIGSRVMPISAALAGASQLIEPFMSLSRQGELFKEFGVTTGGAAMPPEWVAAPPAPEDRGIPLRNLISPTHRPGLAEFKERFGCRSVGCFSMTEISVPICDPAWDSAFYDDQGRLSCGTLRQGYPGYEARIVDEHDLEVPHGQVGELIVRTAAPWTINAGYLNMPEATAAAWRNGWFHTGDGFLRDAEGHFVFIDRLKDAIRRRGENISSAEVEALVSSHPDVRESAAIAVKHHDHPGADEEVKAVVVLAEGATVDEAELMRWLIPRMPRFMIPRYLEFVPELPKTPTFKVRKAELRQRGLNEATWDREAAGIDLPRHT